MSWLVDGWWTVVERHRAVALSSPHYAPLTVHIMVVQKAGRASVADPDAIQRVIAIARTVRKCDGCGTVLVMSAMSKTTDALLTVAVDAGTSRIDMTLPHFEQLCERYVATAGAPTAQIHVQLNVWTGVAKALVVLRAVSVCTLEVIAAIGELSSSRIVTVLEEVLLRMISKAASPWNNSVIMRETDLQHSMHLFHEECFA